MAGLGDFARRTDKVALAEKLTGLYTEFTADNFFIQTVVAVDDDAVYASLRAFEHAQLEVDTIVVNIFLNRHQLIEEVSLIHICIRHGVVVGGETFLQFLLIVNVAGLHSQEIVELVGIIYGVADPGNITNVIFMTFFKVNVDVDLLVVVWHDAVAENLGIAIAEFVVFLQNTVEVILIIRLDELFLAEQFEKVAALIGLFYHALQLAVGEHLIAGDIDFMNLDFCMLVDVDVHNHLVFVREVFLKGNLDVGLAETFLIEIFLDNHFGTVHDILRNLIALHEVKTLLKVFALTFLHSGVNYLGNTRLSAQIEQKPNLVAGDFLDDKLSLGKQALTHQALHGGCHVVAGDLDLVALLEA